MRKIIELDLEETKAVVGGYGWTPPAGSPSVPSVPRVPSLPKEPTQTTANHYPR